MSVLVDTIMEKHAFSISGAWNSLRPVQKYKQVAASTPFKIKKGLGQAALVAAPTAYGAHWIDKSEAAKTPSQM